MTDRPKSVPDPDHLPEAVASRVLARASELDAARGTNATIAQLREAAQEAGISARSFDAALAEERAAKPDRRPRKGRSAAIVGIAVLALLGAFVGIRSATPPIAAVGAAPMVEEAVVIRCLLGGDAAQLIRPLLRLPTNVIVYSPTKAPHVLTITGTPAQISEVRALLQQYEATSPACARP